MNYGLSVKTASNQRSRTESAGNETMEQSARVAPADRMLRVLAEAGVTHAEPLFYGVPLGEYANRLRAIRFVMGRN